LRHWNCQMPRGLALCAQQGCQIGSFGAKNQTFGSFEKHLAPKFLFGCLANFWLFCNYFVPQIFLGKKLRGEHSLSPTIKQEADHRTVAKCATEHPGTGCCDRKSRAVCAQSFAPWQQATIEIMLTISLTITYSRYIYNGVILHAHPARGESHNQRNTTGEVATRLTKER